MTSDSHTRALRRIGTLLLLVAYVCPCASAEAAAEIRTEAEVKAAFLFNFTKFVTWPPSAFEASNSPLSICILGDDPFGKMLDQLVDGEAVGGRKVVVERLHGEPVPKACQVVFVGKTERRAAVMEKFGPGVLTVGDGADFLRDGGMIAFVLDRGHVRFDINQRAASQSDLSLSARLLNVARSVQR
jgi:hypothetical protein